MLLPLLAIVSKIEPDEYIHFDLEASIIEFFSCFSIDYLPNQIDIDFNTVGCNLDRWIYKGSAKPCNSNLFFEKFIADIKKILAREIFKKKKLSIRRRCFITDTPARTFILNHTSHLSCHLCFKCKVCGIRCERRYIFSGSDHSLRTDEEYVRGLGEDHHKEDTSPLSLLLIGIFYEVGVTASPLHIFKCFLSNDIFFIPISEVHIKCFKMPF
ncbi:hypothetical protein ACFW04_013896 [Cataglyphis niger]